MAGADIRYIVECDATGALKSIKELDGAINQAAGTTAKAGGSSGPFGSLFAQFTAGTLVASALQKGIGALKDVVASSITNAIEAEQAENNLKAALEITGRTVEGNIQHYKKFAAEQLKATTYTDEQVMASQALLLQLTSLDQKGLDRATKGAMGLASTMGIDLHSATMMVTKAMEGNYGALGRVGIRVAENLTGEQKQASMLDQLEKLYGRSTKETETFGGAMKQLANNWDEVKEAAGRAIIETEGLGDAFVGLNKAVSNFVSGGAFARFLDQLSRFPVIRNFSDGLKLLALTLELESAKAEHASKVNAGLVVAADTMGKAFAKAAPMLKAFGIDFKGLVDMFASAPAKIDQVGTHTKTLSKEEEAAAKKAAEALKKLGDAAADIVAKYNPLLGAMIKLKAEEDTLTKARKAGAMSAADYDRAMAANAKAMKDVGLEAGKSAKAQAEIAKAAQDIVNRGLGPMHAAMVKAIDDEKKLSAALKAGAITDKDYAKGLETIKKDLDAADAAEKKAKTSTSAFAGSIQDLVNKLKVTGTGFKTATAGEKTLAAALVMGMISLKQYKALLAELNAELADNKGTKKWVSNTVSAVNAISQAVTAYTTYADGMNQQALTRKLSALETEYQAQVNIIANSIMNEEEKTKAFAALEAEYQAARTAAQKSAAQKAKAIAVAGAIMNTAEAVTAALTMKPWTVFNFILAGIAAAMGAVQIALIKSQPIGAAKGAIFKERALLMSQASGQEYEVAEGGEAEIVSSPRQLREAIMGRGAAGGMGTGAQPTVLQVHIYIDGKAMKDFIVKTVRERSKSELMQIHPRAIRAY